MMQCDRGRGMPRRGRVQGRLDRPTNIRVRPAWIRTLPFLLFFLAVPGPLTAQEGGVWARVDSVFLPMDSATVPGCALSVMEEGQPVYLRGYGMANLEYDIPITPSSVFHVASVSKQFTAFAVSLLVAEGRVSWEDDIRTYLPDVPDFGEAITLRHLVNHTSGIRDQWDLLSMAGWRFEADVITQDDVLDITSRQTALNFPVGAEYLYSNTGFTLLAVVVERVSGQTLKDFTQERIFGPLGMTGTHFHDDHNTIVRNRAYAYAPLRDGGYRISIPDFDVVGATSLHTTVEDMARWDRNFYSAEVGGPEVVEEMHRRGILRSGDTIDYALGLSHGRYRGLPTVGHGGSDAGYRSQFLRFPEQETSLAVLCNFPSSNPGRLATQVADIVLEDAFPSPPPENDDARTDQEAPDPVALAPGDAERLEGFYVREDYDGPQQVRARDGFLWAGSERLLHQGDWTFRTSDGNSTMRFQEQADGSITAQGPDGKAYQRYPRVEPEEVKLEEYVGHYWSDDLGTAYEVRMEEGRLVFWHRKIGTRPLTPRFPDGFSAGTSILFTRDSQGTIDAFTQSSGRVWKIRFRKLDAPLPG